MNCSNCEHALIEHGDYPEEACDCCAGRKWVKTEAVEDVRRDADLLPKFRRIPGFPDYMINSYGSVRHIPTKKYCLFLRLTTQGEPLISTLVNGKTRVVTIQELLRLAYPEKHTKEKTDD